MSVLNTFLSRFGNHNNHKREINSLEDLGIIGKEVPKAPYVIYNHVDRMIKYRELDKKLIPEDSIPRYYKGEYRHYLEYKKDKLRVIEPPREKKQSDSPGSFAVILRKIETLIPKAIPMKSNFMEKIKITLLVVFCFAELIVLFLIANVFSGGKI